MTIRLLSAALALACLSACAARPAAAPPAVEVRTVTIDRPVPVPCVKRSAIPAEPPKISGKLTGDARRDLDTVTASAVRLRSWGVELVAILTGCVP